MAFLKFNQKKSILGLDIGSKMTKLAQLSFNVSGKPVLERCDLLETGRLDPDFESKLKAFIKSNKLGNSLVASAIEDPSMKIRKMELPKMPDADMIEAIKWNFRDAVDGEIEDFMISFSKISDSEDADGAKVTIMGYAIKKTSVEDYQQLITSVGLQAFFIEPAAVTLAAALERVHGDDGGFVAGVHIGFSETIFYVIGNGVFVFSRPLIGINLDGQIKEPKTFNQKLAIEIQKSIDTFKVNFKMQDINHLYVSGGGALVPDTLGYLTTNMGLKTELLNPFVVLENTTQFEGVQPTLFTLAVGLALLTP